MALLTAERLCGFTRGVPCTSSPPTRARRAGAPTAPQSSPAATTAGQAAHSITYEVDYLPIRFTCRLDDKESFAVGVPPYVNPSVAVLGLGAVALAIGATWTSERRARTTAAD